MSYVIQRNRSTCILYTTGKVTVMYRTVRHLPNMTNVELIKRETTGNHAVHGLVSPDAYSLQWFTVVLSWRGPRRWFCCIHKLGQPNP